VVIYLALLIAFPQISLWLPGVMEDDQLRKANVLIKQASEIETDI
jgi:hypothetical protein